MSDIRVLSLLAGCVLFAGVVVAELLDSGTKAELLAVKPIRSATVPLPAVRSPRNDGLVSASLARPLFSPTRRPPEMLQAGANPSAEFTDKRLAGIVIDREHRLAIFAVAGAKPLVLSEGDTVNGWRIENISPTEVALLGSGGTRTLQPKPDPAAIRQSRAPARRNAVEQRASTASPRPASAAGAAPDRAAPTASSRGRRG